jgi:hypothetical protein
VWPDGNETWVFHDELPQRIQFIYCSLQLIPAISTSNIVEFPMQQMSSDCDCVVSSIAQQPNEIILVLQQLLVKQNLLLDENKQLNRELKEQQIIINNLSQTVEAIQENQMSCENIPPDQQISTSFISKAAVPVIDDKKRDSEEQDVKDVQFQEINQLMNYNLSSGFYSQDWLTRIGDYNHDCGHKNIKTSSVQSTFINIILTLFILISMAFKIFSSSLIIHSGTNTSYSGNHMLFHSVNDLDWFRTLAVP